MKKLIIILFAFALLFGSANTVKSQIENGYVSFTGTTTSGTATSYLVIPLAAPITKNFAVTILVVPVNTSGTATVTAMPQYSFDGTNWYDLQASGDTVNNAGTVAVKSYFYTDAYGFYYRVKLVSSGTGVTAFTGKFGMKKPTL